jgi:3-hydroxyacyl-CoA dehydrogenase
MSFLREAFLRIAMGQVTTSAHQALDAGFFSPLSRIEMRPGNVLEASKAAILEFADGNYIPRAPRAQFVVPGANGRAVLEVGIEGFLTAGQISEYDAYLARRLAWAITGGDLSDAAVVPPQYLYALERQVFVELVKNPGTHQKMARFAKG